MNILRGFLSNGKMTSVNVEIHWISERCRLHQFHLIAGKTTHFKKFQRNDFCRKFFDDTSLAPFKIGYRATQCLFRLILNKAKIRQNSGLEKLEKRKDGRIELKMIIIRNLYIQGVNILFFFQNLDIMQKFFDGFRICAVVKASNAFLFIDQHKVFGMDHIKWPGIPLTFSS